MLLQGTVKRTLKNVAAGDYKKKSEKILKNEIRR